MTRKFKAEMSAPLRCLCSATVTVWVVALLLALINAGIEAILAVVKIWHNTF